jgi:hypothetical protein
MNTKRPSAFATIGLAVLLAGLTCTPLAHAAPKKDKKDKTDPGNLGAQWVQMLVSYPTPVSPYLDSTGTKCGLGQAGPTWFLFAQGGPLGEPFESTCTIPSDKRILLPLLPGFCIPDPNQTIEQSAQDCADGADASTVLLLQIDDVEQSGLVERRTSRRPFSLPVPEDNAFGLPGGIFTAVADGFFASLPQLAVGDHTIRVQVSITFMGETQSFDTRYLLHIVEPAATLPFVP